MSSEIPAIGELKGKTIAIVAMGASAASYVVMAAHSGGKQRVADFVVAINAMAGVIHHDLLIAMDDLRVQEERIRGMEAGEVGENPPLMGTMQWLRHYDRPWLTSRAWPEKYPHAEEFPIEAVVGDLGTAYMNNTVAWAVAWAIAQGAARIKLFGADFSYPNRHGAEAGRGCVEYLLGIAHGRGIQIEVPVETTLLDANVPAALKPYGYDTEDVKFEWSETGVTVTRTPRDAIPTAAEMEHRYRRIP